MSKEATTKKPDVTPSSFPLLCEASRLKDFPPKLSNGELMAMDTKKRDKALVDDLLFVLLGINGLYFELNADKHFELKQDLDVSINEIVTRVLNIADSYVQVASFVSSRAQLSLGRVNHALSACIDGYLNKFLSLVTQLEQMHIDGFLTLSKLAAQISVLEPLLLLLSALVEEAERKALKGGQIVNLLFSKHRAAGLIDNLSDSSSQEVLQRLLEAACVPYFQTLRTWLTDGIVDDPYGEFCISINNKVAKRSATELDFSYWESKYLVNKDHVPVFLSEYMTMILNTGKYLHVVRDTGDEADVKALEDALQVDQLAYHIHHHEFVAVLKGAHKVASARLLRVLLGKYELAKVLASVKHYFFLDAGDLFVHFLDLAEPELAKKAVDVFAPRLQTHFDSALRLSSAKFDPFAENVRIALLPFKFLTHLQYMHEKSSAGQLDPTLSPPDQDLDKLLGVEALCLSYEVKWPLSLVLSQRSIARYQLLFRVLFYYKVIERALTQTWTQHIHSKQFDLGGALTATFALRTKMLSFVQTYQSFMLYEVIAPQWALFQQSLDKHETVDDLIASHDAFLATCMKQCALTDPSLIIVLSKLTSIAKIFADYSFRFMDGLEGDIAGSLLAIKERLTEEGDDARTAEEYADLHPTQLHRIATLDVQAEQSSKIRENDGYNKTIQKFEDNVNHFFRLLLDSLNKQTSDADSGALASVLLARLDYNNYFAKKFGAATED